MPIMGIATNIVAAQPTLSSVSSNSHCHPADSVFDTNILYLVLFCPSLCRYAAYNNKPDCERDRVRVSITSSLMQWRAPGLVPIMKFKTMKINFEGLFRLSMKISTHENYPPYSSTLNIFNVKYFQLRRVFRIQFGMSCTIKSTLSWYKRVHYLVYWWSTT